jgi:hypothetical protein
MVSDSNAELGLVPALKLMVWTSLVLTVSHPHTNPSW